MNYSTEPVPQFSQEQLNALKTSYTPKMKEYAKKTIMAMSNQWICNKDLLAYAGHGYSSLLRDFKNFYPLDTWIRKSRSRIFFKLLDIPENGTIDELKGYLCRIIDAIPHVKQERKVYGKKTSTEIPHRKFFIAHSEIGKNKVLLQDANSNLYGFCDPTGKILVAPQYSIFTLMGSANEVSNIELIKDL